MKRGEGGKARAKTKNREQPRAKQRAQQQQNQLRLTDSVSSQLKMEVVQSLEKTPARKVLMWAIRCQNKEKE
jgi:hypothetical protein